MSSISRKFNLPSPEVLKDLFFPQWLEYNAVHNAEHVFFAHETALGSGEVKTINWKALYSGFTKAADYVTTRVGAFSEPPVIGVLGNLDTITYYGLLGGIWLTGAVPFLISPRNSAAAVAHLLTKTNASVLFVSADEQMQTLATTALESLSADTKKIKRFPTPEHNEIFSSSVKEFAPLKLPSSVNMTSPALILHSSGSTAFPKPIVLTHHVLKEWAAAPLEPDANPDIGDYRIAMHAAPVFHTMGIIALVATAASGGELGVYPPADPPIIPSPEGFITSAVATKCDVIYGVPRFLELWSQEAQDVEIMKTFKAILFGGGPLGHDIGDRLVQQGVKITNAYGSTEVGVCIPFFQVPYLEWEWITISERMNVNYRPIDGEPGHFELVFLDGERHTPSVLNTEVDGVKGFGTNDIVIRHPTDPKKVKILGRADDQIMLSTGEKTNPGPMEEIITRNALVTAAVMFGRGRDQNGIIIQPSIALDPSDEAAVTEYRNKIWPSVEEANAYAPTHSRIFKEMIVVANPAKPFRYTPKQSIIRKSTLADYRDEIEAAYTAVALSAQKGVPGPSEWTYEGVHDFVDRVVFNVLEKHLGDDDDFFLSGGDSLRATWMRNSILYAVRRSHHAERAIEVGQGFVYSNPTIKQLTTTLYTLIDSSESTKESAGDMLQKRIETLESLTAEFSHNFPTHHPDASKFKGPTDGNEVILITGTTGGLGAQMVATYAALPNVQRVYAFNRPSRQPLKDRQRQAFEERGLDASLLGGGKIVLVEGITEKDGFEISKELYAELRDNVTLIIHNAWRVNFVLQVASYKPLLQGTRNVVDFALASPRAEPPRIIYTGSVSVFSNWGSLGVDEAPREDPIPPQSAIASGYSESKFVAEQILDAAAKVTPLRPISVRVGQMTGTASGAWNNTDWVPAIARSAQVLGVLPDREDKVAWFSLDMAARALFEFRTAPHQHLNLQHPKPYSWHTVMSEFSKLLGATLVPYAAWVEKLKEVNTADPNNEKRNPAALLIDFFSNAKIDADPRMEAPGNTPFMSMEKALASSESLRQAAVDPVDIESDARRWVVHWKATGLLD